MPGSPIWIAGLWKRTMLVHHLAHHLLCCPATPLSIIVLMRYLLMWLFSHLLVVTFQLRVMILAEEGYGQNAGDELVRPKDKEHKKTPKKPESRKANLVGCLMSQQHACVSQGWICSDNFACCHTEIEVSDQSFYLNQSQYTEIWLTSPSADPITPGAWQGSH